MIHAAPSAPPAFAWDDWYAAVGGRTIRIEEAAEYMRKIREDQEPRFTGPVAPTKQRFPTPEDAARQLKEKALELGPLDASLLHEAQSLSVAHRSNA